MFATSAGTTFVHHSQVPVSWGGNTATTPRRTGKKSPRGGVPPSAPTIDNAALNPWSGPAAKLCRVRDLASLQRIALAVNIQEHADKQ